jgi:hypothetical protein
VKLPSRNLSQRLVLYGLGAGAVTAGVAYAGKHKPNNHISYSGPLEFSDNTIHFDLQNMTPPSTSFNSGDDFKMKSDCSNSKAKIKGEGNYNPEIGASIRYSRPYAFKFSQNAVIGTQNFYSTAYFNDLGAGPTVSSINGASGSGNDAGDWQPGDRGFLALRITIDCNNYFGWADVTLNNLDCDGPVFTLHSYALNTEPNETIKAGEIKEKKKHLMLAAPTCTPTPSPTPTPTPTPTPSLGSPVGASVAAISLLLAGASGVTTLKRRNSSSSI